MHETTRLLHKNEHRQDYFGAINPPVVHASVFGFETYQEFLNAQSNPYDHPWYSRIFNPTVHVLEDKIADMENAEAAIAFSSGMAAITAPMLALLCQGDHLLVVDSVFGPARNFFNETLRRLGVDVEYFSSNEANDLSSRIRHATRLIYLESPASLTYDVQDLAAVGRVARGRDVFTIVDNTCATPLFQRPLDLGIDIVVHSGTKYLSWHSDLTIGFVACSKILFRRIKPMAVLLGANPSLDDAYLALRGLRTLPLRMARHQESGFHIARWLQQRPEVQEVLHPGLPSSPFHRVALRQQSGFSGSFTVRLQPTTKRACHAFVDALKVFTIGSSWGGFKSLVMPIEYVHCDEPDWRTLRGLEDSMFRLSIGLEDPDDLTSDLEKGLKAWRKVLDACH